MFPRIDKAASPRLYSLSQGDRLTLVRQLICNKDVEVQQAPMGGECDCRSRGVSILSGHRRIWLAEKYNAGQQRSLRQHYGDMRIDY
jgi:hypothetical protein